MHGVVYTDTYCILKIMKDALSSWRLIQWKKCEKTGNGRVVAINIESDRKGLYWQHWKVFVKVSYMETNQSPKESLWCLDIERWLNILRWFFIQCEKVYSEMSLNYIIVARRSKLHSKIFCSLVLKRYFMREIRMLILGSFTGIRVDHTVPYLITNCFCRTENMKRVSNCLYCAI